MKKHLTILILTCFLFAYAQETKHPFQLNFGSDIGNSKVEMNDQSINSSTIGLFVDLNYSLKFIRFETGLGYFNTQGNWAESGNSYFMENQYLNIPLGISGQFGFKRGEEVTQSPLSLLIGVGVYTNYLMQSKIEGLNKENDLGWNFGMYSKIGANFQMNDLFALGVGLKTQRDFSDIDKNDISVKQNRNVFYFNLGFDL